MGAKGEEISPRTPLTAAPYAMIARNNWSLTGNSGTDGGASNFLGTTDDKPLELHVNNARALRLEYTIESPNVIGGYSGNSVPVGVFGATIGGGGESGSTNRVLDQFGTVAGGKDNQAGDGVSPNDQTYATVGGGINNTASGAYATVPGGYSNVAGGIYSFAAGCQAKANHTGSFVWADSMNADFASTVANTFLIRASAGVGIGMNSPQGALDIDGSIYQRGGVLHADYVFEPDYELESIEEHAAFMWQNKHLKAIPEAKADENGQEIIEVGAHRKGIVEELEKAHIYIEQLHGSLKEHQGEIEALQAAVAGLEAQIKVAERE